jgi:hypothetical protein
MDEDDSKKHGKERKGKGEGSKVRSQKQGMESRMGNDLDCGLWCGYQGTT